MAGLSNVWVECLRFSATNAAGETNRLVLTNTPGAVLASCIVEAGALVSGCAGVRVVGNTFDYTNGTAGLVLTNCFGAVMRNNIYINDGTNAGVTFDPAESDSDYNCYWPTNGAPAGEPNSLYANPRLKSGYGIASLVSAALFAGQAVTGLAVDVLGNLRHPATPCLGAYEYAIETNAYATTISNGCITARRTAEGHDCKYEYDASGRLVAFMDKDEPANNAAYDYDPFGRRIRMQVGDSVTRMVYQGEDVVAEYTDQDGNGTVDKARIYWLLPEIDQRIGFVDIEGESKTFYYYLCDQVGSVLQVIREDGEVVNQYDYDAWGNLREENSYETVENRYRFQGREWDAHAGHYYWRNRIYFPELGRFASPDMNLSLGPLAEPHGMASHVFCGNDPLSATDSLGLAERYLGTVVDVLVHYDPEQSRHASVVVTDDRRIGHPAVDVAQWYAQQMAQGVSFGELSSGDLMPADEAALVFLGMADEKILQKYRWREFALMCAVSAGPEVISKTINKVSEATLATGIGKFQLDQAVSRTKEGDEREEHLDRRLVGQFLGTREPALANLIGLDPEHGPDAHAHLVGLDKGHDERLHVRVADPVAEVLHGFAACGAELDFEHHAAEFLADRVGIAPRDDVLDGEHEVQTGLDR